MHHRRMFQAACTLAVLVLASACGGGGDSYVSGPPADVQALGDQPSAPRGLDHAQIASGALALTEVLAAGERLFAAPFNTLDGAGRPETRGTGTPRDREVAPRNFNRLSAPDANACAGCHNLPRLGGGGDNVANVFVLAQRLPFLNFDGGAGDDFTVHTLSGVANERNTLGMFGAGFVELLAREMTAALLAIRDEALAAAQAGGGAVTRALQAKGVSFGTITAFPDGTLQTDGVQGVDRDLVVKPFHQKGVVVSLREFTNNAMNHHHGMQSAERFGAGTDPDADGMTDELSVGDITALTLFQATLPAPGRVMPGGSAAALAEVARGEQLFATLGCATCHVPELTLASPVFSEPNPYNPPGNLRPAEAGAPILVDLTQAGPGPHLPREPDGTVRVPAYTDLKRHDMGPGLDNEALVQGGVPTRHFLTKKLWGMASEPPFLHHGRATTLSEAVLLHGGEAQAARDAFAAAPAADRDAVIAFLKTLQVLPPDAPARVATGPFSGTLGDEPALADGHVSQAAIEAGLLTPAQLFELGRKVFSANFNTLDGAGRPESTGTGAPRPRREAPENFNRLSGPDANSCAGCHNVPRVGGGGDNVANVFVLAQALPFLDFDGGAGDGFEDHDLLTVANERNTLGMFGAGFIELLAREMTRDLRAQRDQALAEALATGQPRTVALATKGVAFGTLTARPDQTLDLSGLQGVDADLGVKPFHQKGVVVSLREFTNNAMNHHHGIQSRERFGAGADPDADGVTDELSEGDVTAATLFQALLPVPGRILPLDAALRRGVERGEVLFAQVGCAECHRPTLVLDDPVFTEPSPLNPPGNLRPEDVTQVYAVDLTLHGPGPRLSRRADGKVEVPAFTDLKRHDMGPDLAEPKVQGGVPGRFFLTKKLWGAANEPPFMHHGRALTLDEAIRMHGGEGAAARAAYLALSALDRRCLVDFLRTLEVMPEDGPLVDVR